MSRIIRSAARTALVLAVAMMLGVAGCGGPKINGGDGDPPKKERKKKGEDKPPPPPKKLNEADQARLNEARKAAEDAEKKLSELRLERMQLEGGQ